MTHYFITGASSGLGEAISQDLMADGHYVTGIARRLDRLNALEQANSNFKAIAADVTDSAAMLAASKTAERDFGAIDTAILNAGIYSPVDATNIDPDVFRQHMEINYMGVIHGLAAILPSMLARKSGHIVIIASVAGWMGLPKSAAYGPTKSALISLAESLWFDLTPKGIKVQVVCPGFIQTEATAQNDFEMPGLMTAPDAAAALKAGMAKNQFEVAFPASFSRMMRMLKWLPYSLYFKLIQKRTG